MATQTRKRPHEKERYAGRVEIRNTRGSDLMVDEVHTKYVERPPCVTIFLLHDRIIDGGALCKPRSRLLVAPAGRVRFGC